MHPFGGALHLFRFRFPFLRIVDFSQAQLSTICLMAVIRGVCLIMIWGLVRFETNRYSCAAKACQSVLGESPVSGISASHRRWLT